MSGIVIELKERTSSEKSRRLRRNGQVPCVLYGESPEKTKLVKLDYLTLTKLLKTNSMGSIIKLKFNDELINCIVKEVQRDAVSGKIVHVDFQHVKKDEIVKMIIPVDFVGLESLQGRKLILETFINEIEMQGKVQEIPETIKVDVSKMNFEDKIFVRDISLPEDIRILTDKDSLVAVINSTEASTTETDETDETESTAIAE